MRKFIGFILGFSLALFALAQFFSAARAIPRGPFWVFLCIAGGLLGARLAHRPKDHLTEAKQKLQPITRPWWTLEKRLRLVIVGCVVWMLAAYFIQDKYEENMGLVFIPAVAALALHFLVRTTVERPQTGQTSSEPLKQSGFNRHSEDVYYDAIAQELDSGAVNKGLWVKLFAECNGDEAQTKVRYIKERMLMLSSEQQNVKRQAASAKERQETSDQLQNLSAKDRERAMDEMISRMK